MKTLRKLIVMVAATLFAGLFNAHGGVYDGWGYRMKIQIAGYDKPETLTNFPMLVVLSTNIPNFRYADFNSSSNGADLRFAASNKTTELNYEIEKWDNNGSSYVWVQIPTISSTNDFIYAYWSMATNAAPCTTNGAVWSEGFGGVWHLNESTVAGGSGATILDSTTNHFNGIQYGDGLSAGKVGGGQVFDGNDVIICGNVLSPGSSPMTVSVWFKPATTTPEMMLYIKEGVYAASSQPGGYLQYAWQPTWAWLGGPSVPLTTGTWYYSTIVYDKATQFLYSDGALKFLRGQTGDIGGNNTDQLRFGMRSSNGAPYNGVLDEIQISLVARSSNWVWASWCNQATPASFLSITDAGYVSTSVTVSAYAASDIGTNRAVLNGRVLSAGGAENPKVFFCWDGVDQGVGTTSAWAHVIAMGTVWGKGDFFGTNILGLVSGSSYVYRCYATNTTGDSWSDLQSFTTINLPGITNQGATVVKTTTAVLQGQVTHTGVETPLTWFEYWADGASTTSSVSMGRQSGVFSNEVPFLLPATLYHYQALVSNMAGMVVSAVMDFTTRSPFYYVAVDGSGSPGTSWATAFTNLQAAIDAGGNGAVIRMKAGIFAADSQVTVSNLSAITIDGGYAGDTPEPGALSASPTILTRGAAASRILYGYASTVTLTRVSIQGGYLEASESRGIGIYFQGNGRLTLRDCLVSNNFANASYKNYGAGVCVEGGLLAISNSAFANNSIRKRDWSTGGYGGAIAASGAVVQIIATSFEGCYTWARHAESFGGALYLADGQAEIRDCRFLQNRALVDGQNDGTGQGWGGAVCALNVAPLSFEDCYFSGNRISHLENIYGTKCGGVLYLGGASSRASLKRCVLAGNGDLGDESGDIYLAAGLAGLTNVLMAGSTGGSGLYIAGGTAAVAQCTVVSNMGYGLVNYGGSLTVQNAIIKLNALGGIFSDYTARYSCAQEVLEGEGNSVVDPLFVDTVYYHLKSRAGYYSGGYFSGGSWTTAAEDSPLIDAGDPLAGFAGEPPPDGFRVNVGAYGNSLTASKSYVEAPGVFSVLTVHAYPAVPMDPSRATLRGQVLSSGGAEAPATFFCWDNSDAGTASTGSWSHVIAMGSRAEWELFSTAVTGLVQGVTYHSRCYVTNSAGADWSDDMHFSSMGVATIENPGPTQVLRHSARLQGRVLANGGDDPTVWLWHWQEGSSTTSIIPMGVQGIFASFSTNVGSLAINTPYSYKILGSNSIGSVWSGTVSYSTLDATPIGRYVTASGSGVFDGSNWENAFPSLARALEDCNYPGDRVYLKYGNYLMNASAVLSGLAGPILSGGYAGVGAPGVWTNAQTVFSRVVNKNIRIFYGTSTTVTLDRITIEGGVLTGSGDDGAGLYFTGGSDVTLTNCVVTNNSLNIAGIGDGAGLYVNGGRLRVFDCAFIQNQTPKSDPSTGAHGNGLCAIGAETVIAGTRFAGNWSQTRHVAAYGGAVYLDGGLGDITNCQFVQNSSINEGNTDGPGPARGGALAALNMGGIMVEDCVFTNNKAYTPNAPNGGSRQGSALYFYNSTGAVVRCVMNGNGHASEPYGVLYTEGGRIGITNVLVVYSQSGNGIYMTNGNSSIDLCTVATNAGCGIVGDAATVVRNSIAWDNAAGGITNAMVAYSCSQEPQAGVGNVAINPVFLDTIWFHLAAHGGCLSNGYFTGGTWIKSTGTSPLIDAGDPASDYSHEPSPRGRRINMGAYANTAVASMTVEMGTILIIR